MASVAVPLGASSPAAGSPATAEYRADIDGLRAVAVLPVVLFHAGIERLGGGYVGVDVFFVISGYLITCIIWREVRDGRFSIVNFYERRVRRIFPALAVLLAAVMVAAAILYLPRDFSRVPGSVAATLGFVSNVLFYTQVDYFDAPAQVKPLLHTWSLAVEEQYYLFFPLFMAFMYRWARRWLVPALVGIAILSFLMSAWGAYNAPTFTFYMAPTRVWELFAGSLLAIGLVPAVRSRAVREFLAAAGLVLIGIAVLAFTEATPFPGVAALLPVVGSALVIHCADRTSVGNLLSRGPFVFIGLISYSLYLWHWPVIVFWEYHLSRPLAPGETAAAVLVAVLAAWLSWRFVERPFRDRRRVDRRAIFRTGAIAAAALAAASAAMAATGGWQSRFSAEALRRDSYAESFNPRRDSCNRQLGRCSYGADVPAAYALWGDSHGLELVAALGEVAAPEGAAVSQFTFPGCAPVAGEFAYKTPGCRAFSERALSAILDDARIHTVILVANLDAERYREDSSFAPAYARAVAALQRGGKRVVIVYPNPVHPADVPRALALRAPRSDGFGVAREEFLRRNGHLIAFLDRVGGAAAVRIRPHETLCRARICATMAGSDLLYWDNGHLSREGARLVAASFRPLFSAPPARP